jgi:hypothetical protein
MLFAFLCKCEGGEELDPRVEGSSLKAGVSARGLKWGNKYVETVRGKFAAQT